MEKTDVMRKVQALMDRADSTTFEAERDACLAKADQLMAAYAIEQFELDMARPVGDREKPEVRFVDIPRTGDYDVDELYRQLFTSLIHHVGAMYVDWKREGYRVIGFKSDLDWFDWLFQSIRLHMLNTMKPKPSTDLSLEENIVMLKETGLKWADIYDQLLPVFHSHPKFRKYGQQEDMPVSYGYLKFDGWWFPRNMPRPWGVWCTGVYTNHCKKHNLPRNYASPTVYRRSFVEGYMARIRARLAEMREARGQAEVGKGLVLAGKEGDLKELLYELRPELRPHPDDCDCDRCHRCADPKCQRLGCVAARKPLKFRAARYVEHKIDHGAMRNGARAANSADLMGGRGNVGGSKAKEIK